MPIQDSTLKQLAFINRELGYQVSCEFLHHFPLSSLLSSASCLSRHPLLRGEVFSPTRCPKHREFQLGTCSADPSALYHLLWIQISHRFLQGLWLRQAARWNLMPSRNPCHPCQHVPCGGLQKLSVDSSRSASRLHNSK